MNPSIEIQFSCLEELAYIAFKVRDAYRVAGAESELVGECLCKAQEFNAIGIEALAKANGRYLDAGQC